MIYKIHPENANTLLEKPETGMGYQIVNASQYNQTQIKKFVVYNTNLAVELDSCFEVNKQRIMNEGYKNVLNNVQTLMLETDSIKVLDHSSIREYTSKILHKESHSGGKGATDNTEEEANGNEVFVRLSAFEDDKRVDIENKRLEPGTFTTTKDDYKDCVSTNDDPIDRYSLPNDDKIKWSFYIIPSVNDILQRGIVQPDFGHKGGGIEAYFKHGTSKGTFLYKKEYGK